MVAGLMYGLKPVPFILVKSKSKGNRKSKSNRKSKGNRKSKSNRRSFDSVAAATSLRMTALKLALSDCLVLSRVIVRHRFLTVVTS